MRAAVWKVSFAAVLSLGVLSVASAPSYAAGGYGPLPPPGLPPGAPGAFGKPVLVAETVGRSGGKVSTTLTNSANTKITVTVRAGTFGAPVQVAITGPPLSELSGLLPALGYRAYVVVAGFGVWFSHQNGQPVTGRFSKAVTIMVTGPKLGVPGEKVLELTSPTKSAVLPATLRKSTVSFSIRNDPALVVANPASPKPGPPKHGGGLPRAKAHH